MKHLVELKIIGDYRQKHRTRQHLRTISTKDQLLMEWLDARSHMGQYPEFTLIAAPKLDWLSLVELVNTALAPHIVLVGYHDINLGLPVLNPAFTLDELLALQRLHLATPPMQSKPPPRTFKNPPMSLMLRTE